VHISRREGGFLFCVRLNQDAEYRAFANPRAFCADAPPARVDYGFRYRKPYACSACAASARFIGAVKAFKDMGDVLCRYTASRVGNRNQPA
jgi:hypothetical protein